MVRRLPLRCVFVAIDHALAAIVEQVRDGSTLRVRLLLPDGDHQFVNLTLAGVKSPRFGNRSEETPEQFGEEAGALNHVTKDLRLTVTTS